MKTEHKILTQLLTTKEPLTIREIAKRIQADYHITHEATQRLLHRNILLGQTIGKSTACRLDPSYYGSEIYLAEEERKKEVLKNKDLAQLYRHLLSHMLTSFFVLLVFGSHAKKTATVRSDIDLLLITNQERAEEKMEEILATIPLNTHPIVITEAEFVRLKNAKPGNVIHEVMHNYIILYGTEAFYHLKNA